MSLKTVNSTLLVKRQENLEGQLWDGINVILHRLVWVGLSHSLFAKNEFFDGLL
jgi:hypothetical protein